jgi:hypothetical protein
MTNPKITYDKLGPMRAYAWNSEGAIYVDGVKVATYGREHAEKDGRMSHRGTLVVTQYDVCWEDGYYIDDVENIEEGQHGDVMRTFEVADGTIVADDPLVFADGRKALAALKTYVRERVRAVRAGELDVDPKLQVSYPATAPGKEPESATVRLGRSRTVRVDCADLEGGLSGELGQRVLKAVQAVLVEHAAPQDAMSRAQRAAANMKSLPQPKKSEGGLSLETLAAAQDDAVAKAAAKARQLKDQRNADIERLREAARNEPAFPLRVPLTLDDGRMLKVGDVVELSGLADGAKAKGFVADVDHTKRTYSLLSDWPMHGKPTGLWGKFPLPGTEQGAPVIDVVRKPTVDETFRLTTRGEYTVGKMFVTLNQLTERLLSVETQSARTANDDVTAYVWPLLAALVEHSDMLIPPSNRAA